MLTCSNRFRARRRMPSCLTSCSQPGPAGVRSVSVSSHGRMSHRRIAPPEGREGATLRPSSRTPFQADDIGVPIAELHRTAYGSTAEVDIDWTLLPGAIVLSI